MTAPQALAITQGLFHLWLVMVLACLAILAAWDAWHSLTDPFKHED